jgi:anti-sigma B factor antagonist
MNVTSERTPESFVIIIKGDIDATTSIQVDAEINQIYQLPLNNLWIDCCEVQYISSAGVGVFISHLQKMEKRKINMTVYGLKPKIKSVFTVLGLDHYLTLQPSLKDLSDRTVTE